MIYDSVGLKTKIEMYFNKEITLQELGHYCENAYYDIIKGEYLCINSLMIYPLIKKLDRLNVEPNDIKDEWPSSPSEINTVYEVLAGKRNAVFAIKIGLPTHISRLYTKDYNNKKEQYCQLKTILSDYLSTGVIADNSASMIESISTFAIKRSDTILDIIENHILAYILTISVDESQLRLMNPLGIYCEKRESMEDSVRETIEKVVRCIDCYIGDKNVDLQISYTDGIPKLNTFLY